MFLDPSFVIGCLEDIAFPRMKRAPILEILLELTCAHLRSQDIAHAYPNQLQYRAFEILFVAVLILPFALLFLALMRVPLELNTKPLRF